MFAILLAFILGDITTELSGTVVYVIGEGEVTSALLQSKGDFKQFTEIVIDTGQCTVKTGAFHNMEKLKRVVFGENVTQIEEDLFYACFALSSFVVSDKNLLYSADETCLYNKNKSLLIKAIAYPSYLSIVDSVTTLGQRCFGSTFYYQTLILPSMIESIHKGAFTDCRITEVIFLNSKLTIFSNQLSWATIYTLHIPPSIESITSPGLSYAVITNLIFDNIEESNCSIIRGSFQHYRGKNVTLPPKILEIPSLEFINSNLEYINIPRDCQSVAPDAFKGCVNLKEIRVDDGNQYYMMVGESLYNKEETQLVFVPQTATTITISSKLESITDSLLQLLDLVSELNVNSSNQFYAGYEGCLYNKSMNVLIAVCGGVKNLKIYNETTEIAEQACRSVGISTITFEGNKVQSIGSRAFSGCKNLKKVTIASSVDSFGSYVFAESGANGFSFECEQFSALKSYNIYCFDNSNLKSIIISENITRISSYCFSSVTKLENIEVRGNLTNIDSYAFRFAGIKNVEFVIMKSIVTISNNAFQNCNLMLSFESESQLSTLGTSAFLSSQWSSSSIKIPRLVTSVPSNYFEGSNLVSVSFEDGSLVAAIGPSAFKDCPLLSFTIPTKLKTVDSSMFFQCYSLTSVIESKVMDEGSLKVENNIIYNTEKTTLLICPPGLSEAYVGNAVSTIESNAFYKCQMLENVYFIAPSNIKKISENTFNQCTKLSSVSLPTSVETLGKSCFRDCSSLTRITLNKQSKLMYIEDEAFFNCTSLGQFGFAEATALKTIGISAFKHCKLLKECITNSANLQSIGESAFASSGIQTFEEMSRTVLTLGTSIFKSCLNLRNVTIRSSNNLPNSIFESCENLKEFEIAKSISSIGELSFANCKSLTSLNISSEIQAIGLNAFSGCSSLRYITYCGNSSIPSGCVSEPIPIYVTNEYPTNSFCGVPVLRHLSNDCIILYPTELFTQHASAQVSFAAKYAIQIIYSDGNEGNNK